MSIKLLLIFCPFASMVGSAIKDASSRTPDLPERLAEVARTRAQVNDPGPALRGGRSQLQRNRLEHFFHSIIASAEQELEAKVTRLAEASRDNDE